MWKVGGKSGKKVKGKLRYKQSEDWNSVLLQTASIRGFTGVLLKMHQLLIMPVCSLLSSVSYSPIQSYPLISSCMHKLEVAGKTVREHLRW